MKFKLRILDRVILAQVLPKKSSLTEQVICKGIREKVLFNPKELITYDMKVIDEILTWDAKKEEIKEVDFDHAEMVLLQAIIKKMDEKEEITPDHVGIFNRLSMCSLVQQEQP